MKNKILTLFFLILSSISFGQAKIFDFEQLKFKGLAFSTSKDCIIKLLGHGEIIDSQHQCGRYSNDYPNGRYYHILYDSFSYIGNDTEGFILEHVKFDKTGKHSIKYGKWTLSGHTSKDECIKIFGNYAKQFFAEYPDQNSILLYSINGDDGVDLVFENGKLVSLRYWSPC